MPPKRMMVFSVALWWGIFLAAGELVPGIGLWAVDGDTIVVEVRGDRVEVRLMGVDSLESEECLGEAATDFVQGLIAGPIWLELDPEEGFARRDRNGRLLAHVFLSPERAPGASLGVALVREGLAVLDVRESKDTWPADHFDIRYAPWIIAAQIGAALARKGWWGRCDPFAGADLVVAAIKHWGNDEVVYILNRGEGPVDLARGWKLTSYPPGTQTLPFGRYVRELVLPPGWVLRVHSGPLLTGRGGGFERREGERAIDWYWTGRKIWRREGDLARLWWEEELVYEFVYPMEH